MLFSLDILHRSAKMRYPGLVEFVVALAYHIYLSLPAAFTQPRDHLLAEPCIIGSLATLAGSGQSLPRAGV